MKRALLSTAAYHHYPYPYPIDKNIQCTQYIEYEQSYTSILFHINQYKLQDKDELTVKAIQKAQEDWLIADTIYIDSRIPEDKREIYIKKIASLMHEKYYL